MAIRPDSSPISYSGNAGSGTIYVNSVKKTYIEQDFDRLEFSNKKLLEAPTTTGALPLIVQGFGNQPIQLLTTCTGDIPRSLSPDDANISAIKKRWNITRYSIEGGSNSYTDVNNLLNELEAHLTILNGFDLYLGELSMFLSINYLEGTLQPLTFSTLTSTDLSISGKALQGTISNLLLTEFTWDCDYESPTPGNPSTSQTLYSFSATFENRVLNSAGPLPS